MDNTKYIVVLCHIVKERCSGFLCENAFYNRENGFEKYSKDQNIRYMNITCGGCTGKATLRKLSNLTKLIGKKTDLSNDDITLHFASCICRESFHGPICPHYDYLKEIVERKGIKWKEGTRFSKLSEKRRDKNGKWSMNNDRVHAH